ncbi:MAG: YbaK/EbsC family protein [Oscillospiraceae bacterium]|nr:YbaK/EbsC family protein [Oscillospiraceae bacterium]
MTIDNVRPFLAEHGLLDRLHEFEESTATVELAALALGAAPDQIAKTLSFYRGDGVVLVVAAGERRIDNRKFKDQFGQKARMLSREDVERLTGFAAGGVCPFLAQPGAEVWLDVSLRDHDTVYPAAGNDHSGVALSCAELEALSSPAGWCDVCKPLEP